MSDEKNKSDWAATFNSIIGKETAEKLKTAFAEFKAKFNLPAPVKASTDPAPANPVAPYTATVTGGNPMFVDISDDGIPGIDVGDPVCSDLALTMPYPDGTYNLDDGSSVTISGGVVTAMTPASPAPAPPAAMVAQVAQMRAEFAAQKVEFEKKLTIKFAADLAEIKTAITDHNTQLKALVEFANLAMSTPVKQTPPKKVAFKKLTDVEYNALTPAQQVKYNRGELS